MRIACVNQDRGIRQGSSKGAAVHVAAMRDAFAQCGVDVLEIDEKDAADVEDRLARLHTNLPIDAVYERYALGCDAGSRFCAEAGLPHVLEVNAPLMAEAAAHRGFEVDSQAEELETRIYRGARLVLAVSEAVADSVRVRGVSEQALWVRPNGVDTSRFVPRRRPAGPGGPFLLGFHGRLRPWHGFDLLAQAFADLLDRGHDVLLELVGEGDFAAHLDGRVPAERWSQTGWVPHAEVAVRVARFDALALTYPPEAPCYFSPLKLLEAMAVGAVPVVPRLGDLERVVVHEESGLLYPAGDREALVTALERLIDDVDLRARLLNGAVEVAQGHSWKSMAEEILSELAEASPAC
jgi:glycosyltransferase involved in cell wall biosynthesis